MDLGSWFGDVDFLSVDKAHCVSIDFVSRVHDSRDLGVCVVHVSVVGDHFYFVEVVEGSLG